MDKRTIELNDKELGLVWGIVAWFQSTGVTSSLLRKLYPGDELSHKYREKYQRAIEDRLIEIGDWLKNDREREQRRITL